MGHFHCGELHERLAKSNATQNQLAAKAESINKLRNDLNAVAKGLGRNRRVKEGRV